MGLGLVNGFAWSMALDRPTGEFGVAGLDQRRIADAAAVADPAGLVAAAVATPGGVDGHAQAQGLSHDFCFAPKNQGRPQLGPVAFAAAFAGQIGQALEGAEVVGAAVGVTGIVDGIHAEHQFASAPGFRQAQAEGDEHRVAPGHIGAGDYAALHAARGHGDGLVGEGRAAPAGQVDGDGVVLGQLQGLGNGLGREQFPPVPLAVIKREADHPVARLLGQGGSGGGVQATRQQGDGGGQGAGGARGGLHGLRLADGWCGSW